jgi:hypothetical protein
MKALGRLFDIIPSSTIADSQGASGLAGDYISLKNAKGIVYMFAKAAGTANDDPVLTFRQAQDVAGTAVKDLAVVTTHHQKQAATDLTGTGTWTKVTQAAGATITLNSTSAEQVGLYAIEIEADLLDVDNGFDCIICNVADTGAAGAQYGGVWGIVYGLGIQAAPANLPSAITD